MPEVTICRKGHQKRMGTPAGAIRAGGVHAHLRGGVAAKHRPVVDEDLRRGGAGDAVAAERLLDEAAALASRLGMAKVGRDIDALAGSTRGAVA